MSIRVQAYVWRIVMPPTVKLVAIALADHEHDDGTEARPSQTHLAEKTGLSTQSIRRALGWLMDHGVVELMRASTQHRANVFRFTMDESRGYSVAPLKKIQTYQTRPQTYQRVTPAPTQSTPNHKEPSLEPRGSSRIANPDEVENERIRNDEIERFGRVLTNPERARLARSLMMGQNFSLDA